MEPIEENVEYTDTTVEFSVTPAVIRTAIPAAWAAFVVWAANRWLGIDLDNTDTAIVTPIVTGTVYAGARVFEFRFPRAARVLLGSGRKPLYETVS